MLSSVGDSGKMPCSEKALLENLWPTPPHSAAGIRTEPPVSEPMAKAHRPAAIATAEPPLDPPGVQCTRAFHGFHGTRWTKLMPPSANSLVHVLPKIMQPARRSA